VLLTFGFVFLIADLAALVWGPDPQTIPRPPPLVGAVNFAGVTFPTYRLFVIGVGIAIALGLAWAQARTRVGAIVRAAVDDAEMVRALGINLPLVWTAVFALGGFLAALGGVLGGAFIGVYHGADLEVLLLTFAVVILGGLGSLRGAFVGSLAVGLLDTFGKALFPELSAFTIFAPVALILVVRPTGLFGRA
jgi:branched-chain amino acid transport system permease protein